MCDANQEVFNLHIYTNPDFQLKCVSLLIKVDEVVKKWFKEKQPWSRLLSVNII